MSYLCMDEDGNVYVAATHRSDGQGVEARPVDVDNFEDKNFQNPYLAQDSAARKEGNAAKKLSESQDIYNASARALAIRQKSKQNAAQALGLEKARNNQAQLLAEAISQSMSGADFDQLAIVDAQYGARHAAMLQGMGETPTNSDMNYIQDAEMSPLELEQAKLYSYASNQVMSEAKKKALLSEQESYAKPVNSTIDRNAQSALTGEINFENEDEAKIFVKMTPAQQRAYLLARKGDVYLPSTSEASAQAAPAMDKKTVAIGLIAAAYLLLS